MTRNPMCGCGHSDEQTDRAQTIEGTPSEAERENHHTV
jgi:hypothetical protein